MTPDRFALGFAALGAIAGMALGIAMGLRNDFLLAPVHAHLNLLGWATMALYGLHHRTSGAPVTRLAWLQVGLGAGGVTLFTGGLALHLLAIVELLPVMAAGAFGALASMILFLVMVVRGTGGAGARAGEGDPDA